MPTRVTKYRVNNDAPSEVFEAPSDEEGKVSGIIFLLLPSIYDNKRLVSTNLSDGLSVPSRLFDGWPNSDLPEVTILIVPSSDSCPRARLNP